MTTGRDRTMGKAATLEVFTTCPHSRDFEARDYLRRTLEIASWSDEAGCAGILVYAENSIVDPWLVAQAVLCNTRQLAPLVAVQPIYMNPYSAAKMVASLAFLHGRRIWLNMLAGGFKNDLLALGDTTPHDERYARTVEYAKVMQGLLGETAAFSFAGSYYGVRGLRMTPPVPEELLPGWLISGSSEAGRAAALAIGATAVEYPQPPSVAAAAPVPHGLRRGVRVGIIARPDREEAWRIAWSRFPEDRRGKVAAALAMKTSDSVWHHQLSNLARQSAATGDVYWLWPFENYATFCPYLVGDDDSVAEELARYIAMGARTFILDIPREAADIEDAARVLALAERKAASLAAEPPEVRARLAV
ncbi:LLM class flavin-dependent oxidoreductase [Falsiroseomonas sp. HW251]|uniref:LLM class flavin-dependent oxidoreductase n=1 Tax=Falsiroseomonas sp. HW251 TaxID=3390998 RepID=UPI003D317580